MMTAEQAREKFKPMTPWPQRYLDAISEMILNTTQGGQVQMDLPDFGFMSPDHQEWALGKFKEAGYVTTLYGTVLNLDWSNSDDK